MITIKRSYDNNLELTASILEHSVPAKAKNTEVSTPCRIYKGQRDKGCHSSQGGYPTIAVNGKIEYAHKVIYKLFHGDIPENKSLHHICCNRDCIEKNHIVALTWPEHMAAHAEIRAREKAQKEAK